MVESARPEVAATNPVVLASGNLLLDQPTTADIALVTQYCQDPLFEHYLTLPWPYQRSDAEFFVTEFVPAGWSSGTEATWALRAEGRFLGVIGLRRPTGMIGFWLGAEHRGHGWMPRAVTAVVDWASTHGYVDPVRWECVVGNLASMSVARTTGFTFTGTGPATVTSRDGSHPESWHGELHSTDSREPKPGWPIA